MHEFKNVSNETKKESNRKPAKTMTGFFSRAARQQFTPKNENEMKVNTPSVVQYFSFQTGKQVAEGRHYFVGGVYCLGEG